MLAVLVWSVASGNGPGDAPPAATPLASTTSTTAPPSPTTTTTLQITTTIAPTTTSIAPTTSLVGRADIAAFAERFAAAIETGDSAFVTERLHPEVVAGFGSDICDDWIESDIMTLSNYRLVAGPDGPVDQIFETPGGPRSISASWSGRAAFTFQGKDFEDEVGFAVLDGVVYWLGQCE